MVVCFFSPPVCRGELTSAGSRINQSFRSSPVLTRDKNKVTALYKIIGNHIICDKHNLKLLALSESAVSSICFKASVISCFKGNRNDNDIGY